MPATAHAKSKTDRREERHEGILAVLRRGPATIATIADCPAFDYMLPVTRNKIVRTDLLSLEHRGEVEMVDPDARWGAVYRIRPRYAPAGTWTPHELLAWLASGEGLGPACFERDLAKAVAAVRAIIDREDRRAKGEA